MSMLPENTLSTAAAGVLDIPIPFHPLPTPKKRLGPIPLHKRTFPLLAVPVVLQILT